MKSRSFDLTRGNFAYLYIAPATILTIILSLLPMFYNIYLSFTNFSLYHWQDYEFIGMGNYIKIFTSPITDLWRVGGWSFLFATLAVLLPFALGVFLATLLNNNRLRFRKIYRTILIISWAMPAFITVMMWKGLLNYNFGMVNILLSQIGIDKIHWLENAIWTKTAILGITLWLGFPFQMIMALGVLQSIPKELFEAAIVDGANIIQKFFFITLPFLLKGMMPLLILGFAFAFNNFTVIYLLNDGGPPVPGGGAGSTDVLVSHVFKLVTSSRQYGTAAAYAVIIFIIIGSITVLNMIFTKQFKENKIE